MIEKLPLYISFTFGITSLLALAFFIWTVKNSRREKTKNKAFPILIGLTVWLCIQALLGWFHFYSLSINSLPPRIVLTGIFPAFVVILLLFTSPRGKRFVDSLPIKNLTYLNLVRIPVEIVLYWLFVYGAVPELMTFEGRNFDILAGISAPLIAYFGFASGTIKRKLILSWNFIALALLLNIVINALFAAPSPIQKFAFEQPNIAILYFPFCWLPTFVVPLVLLGHLVSIRQLLKKNNFQN